MWNSEGSSKLAGLAQWGCVPDPQSRAAAARGARKDERGGADVVREAVPTREQSVCLWDYQ